MPSSYKGLDLFGSGPHRFTRAPRGVETTARWRVTGNATHAGSLPLGDLEAEVVVTGRLLAPTEPALRALRDAIAALARFDQTPGTLVDDHGVEHENMWLIEFGEGPIDRGREFSIAYTARFRDFLAI